jgi:hypothetical protein
VDGRSAVTSTLARQHGVMALLCHREACWLRDRGHRWFNHGGDTTFKREISGTHGHRLVMWAWLLGGPRHEVVNRAEAFLWRTRPVLASWVRSVASVSVPRSPGRGARAAATELERRRAAEMASVLAGAARTLREWDAAQPPSEAFARAWRSRLEASAHGHFAMRLDWLEAEARSGHPMRALLLDEPDLRAAAVFRREHEGWTCGWPWRTQFVIEDGTGGAGIDGPRLRRLLDRLSLAAAPLRLRMFLPRVAHGPRGTVAGQTLLKSVALEDAELLASIHSEKRRAIKKAEAAGWTVRLATAPEDWRAFHALQGALAKARGEGEPLVAPSIREGEEAWREWGLPWHWLLVAEHEGVLRAGSGFGWGASGVADYRTNASDEVGRKAGANALLAWKAMLHARDAGCHWVNWGGSTVFKRHFGGEAIEMHSVLGGGALWTVPNQLESAVQQARSTLARWVKRARAQKEGKSR